MEIEKSIITRGRTSRRVLGVRVDNLSASALIDEICNAGTNNYGMVMAYVNVHAMNIAAKTPWFSQFLEKADIAFCDGYGVKWGGKFLGIEIPYRHSPPDWICDLATASAEKHLTWFLLGGLPGVAEAAGTSLTESVPELQIAGVHHGYFNKDTQSEENTEVISAIKEAEPDIIIVGLGMPTQEKWIEENRDELSDKVILPVGALFDVLGKLTYRAPQCITDHGLEWFCRLCLNPRRLWKRYIIGNPVFLLRLLADRVKSLKQ